MTREECAAFFEVSLRTWAAWEQHGRVGIPRYSRGGGVGGGRRMVCYTVGDVTRMRAAMEAESIPTPDPLRPGCWLVPVHTFSGRRFAVIDAADLPKVAGKRWNISERADEDSPRGHVFLATDASVTLKRVITGETHAGREVRITHANGDYLDCRRENLVVRDHAEQVRSARKHRTREGRPCTSKYKGVSWAEHCGKWAAHICKDRKRFYLGLFIDEEGAARAYDEAARRLFGEHARLNFPDEEALLMHRDPTLEARSAA